MMLLWIIIQLNGNNLKLPYMYNASKQFVRKTSRLDDFGITANIPSNSPIKINTGQVGNNKETKNPDLSAFSHRQ